MQRVKKPKPGQALTPQRRSLANPKRQASLFQKGHKKSIGNRGPEARKHKRFITISFINSLAEEIERNRTEIKNGKRKDIKEIVTKEQTLIEALYKGFVVDRNPAVMRLVMEMIEGKTPQEIDHRVKSFNINSNMSLEEASRMYLESIKRTSIDDDGEEDE